MAASEEAQPPARTEATQRGRPRIISIDDDADLSAALKLRLEPYGVEVLRAFSGMQGFWSCLDFRPDVILLDLGMSDGDGSYILHRLRGHSLTEKTPVIILTGITNPAIRREFLSLGVQAYLHKPLVFEELLEHVRRLTRIDAAPRSGA
jgi:DNA-binding response OmpR family regulator